MAADVEEGAESKWVSLPWDLLCPVLSRLALSDLIRSAVVCKRWRLAADEAYDDDDDRPSCSSLGYGGLVPEISTASPIAVPTVSICRRLTLPG